MQCAGAPNRCGSSPPEESETEWEDTEEVATCSCSCCGPSVVETSVWVGGKGWSGSGA